MKKIILPILLFIFSLTAVSQKKTIYITSNVPISYQVYIDEELQYYGIQSDFKIKNIPEGKKILRILTYTNSNQKPSIEINTTNQKEEFYVIDKVGENYVIKRNDIGFKFKPGVEPASINFKPKRKVAIKDSTHKTIHSCRLSDSGFKILYSQFNDLKEKKAKENYLAIKLKHTCLSTSQISAIGNRIDSDEEKYNMYIKYYPTCIDNISYKSLEKTFSTQVYSTKFTTWLDQKLVSK